VLKKRHRESPAVQCGIPHSKLMHFFLCSSALVKLLKQEIWIVNWHETNLSHLQFHESRACVPRYDWQLTPAMNSFMKMTSLRDSKKLGLHSEMFIGFSPSSQPPFKTDWLYPTLLRCYSNSGIAFCISSLHLLIFPLILFSGIIVPCVICYVLSHLEKAPKRISEKDTTLMVYSNQRFQN